MAGTSFYERTPSNARADVPAGRQVAFERVRAQDAFLTAGNAALAHPDSVNGDGQKHGSPQKSVRGGTLLPGELAAGATAREARPSPAAHQISVFDRDSARIAGAMGRDFGSCYLNSLGSAVTEARICFSQAAARRA